MSTCPKKDIHSVYLDNELPSAYLAEYEAHVQGCPACQAELRRLKTVRAALGQDAQSIAPSQAELNASFERLQSRLSYSKTTRVLQPATRTPWLAGIGAAAAVLVAVLVPARLGGGAQTQQAQAAFQPVARTALVAPVSTQASLDDPLGTITMANFLGEDATQTNEHIPVTTLTGGAYTAAYGQAGTYLANYDVFSPLPEEVSRQQEKSKGFSFRFYSPFANVSFEIGSGN